MVGPTLSRAELGVEQARLVQEGGPGLHGIATSASGRERHLPIAGRQMHPVHDGLVEDLAVHAVDRLRQDLVVAHGVRVHLVVLQKGILRDHELARRGVLHLAAVLVIEHVDVGALARAGVPAHAGADDALCDRLLGRRDEVGPCPLTLLHRVGQAVDLVLRPAHLRQQVLPVVHRAGLGVLRHAVRLALQLHRVPEVRDDVLDVALALVLLDQIVERDDVVGADPRREVLVSCEDDVRRGLGLRGERELLQVVAPLPATLEGRLELDGRLAGELLVQRVDRR